MRSLILGAHYDQNSLGRSEHPARSPRILHCVNRAIEILVALAIVVLTASILWDGQRTKIVRPQPLVSPIQVVNVGGFVIDLADGRSFRLAGIRPRANAESTACDTAYLQAACAQGIEVICDLGDGTALIRCEPFVGPRCGNSGILAWSSQCCLNELLLITGHARLAISDRLSPTERWRLRACESLMPNYPSNYVVPINSKPCILPYDRQVLELQDLRFSAGPQFDPPPK